MFRSWKIAKICGIDLYVNWSFLVLIGFALYSNLAAGWQQALYAVGLLCAVFGCVVLHECGHALMARRFGIATRDITLYVIGGVARLERMSEEPWEEFWIAVAGPAVNLVIAAVLGLALWGSMPGPDELHSLPQFFAGSFVVNLLAGNLVLVGFNILPVFPMDGGRVLRALLTIPLGHLRATEIAARGGAIMALLFCLAGIKMPMLILVGIFVFLAGQQELAGVRYRAYLRNREPVDVLPADHVVDVIPAACDPGFSTPVWDDHNGVWIWWQHRPPLHGRWSE